MAARLFAWYTRRLARAHFAGIWLGAAQAPDPARLARAPVLFLANHTNWWDGFLGVLVNRHLGLHFQVLMEARELARYPVFRRVGALPMRRTSATGAYADLEAARSCLRPGSGLWLFPQGRRHPASAPVTATERGAAHLALGHAGPLLIQPVALRYTYLGEQLPEAFIWLGEPFTAPLPAAGTTPRAARQALSLVFEARLTATLAELDARLASEQLDRFTHLLRGPLSINKRLDRVRHFIGSLEGPFDHRNG